MKLDTTVQNTVNFSTNALITSALTTKNIGMITAIPIHMFSDSEAQIVNYIRQFVKKYGSIPSIDVLQKQFPTFRTENIENIPPNFIFDCVSRRLQRAYTNKYYTELEDQGKDYRAIESVEELHRRLVIKKSDIIRLSEIDWDTYSEKQTETISYGIDFLDDTLARLGKTDITYIAARLGSGKTTFLTFLLKLQYIMGKKCIVFSNEIDQDSLIQAITSILLQFDKKKFRLGLGEEEKQLVKSMKSHVKKFVGDIIFAGAYNSINDLLPYVEGDDRPEVIFIDALNLAKGMRGLTQNDRLASIGDLNADLKAFVNEYKIPVIGSIQLNRNAEKTESPTSATIAGSDEFGRIATSLITLSLTDFNGEKCAFINILKARENKDGANSGAYCFIDSKNKMRIRRLTASEANEAAQEINGAPLVIDSIDNEL